jgi:hypothetical protein
MSITFFEMQKATTKSPKKHKKSRHRAERKAKKEVNISDLQASAMNIFRAFALKEKERLNEQSDTKEKLEKWKLLKGSDFKLVPKPIEFKQPPSDHIHLTRSADFHVCGSCLKPNFTRCWTCDQMCRCNVITINLGELEQTEPEPLKEFEPEMAAPPA